MNKKKGGISFTYIFLIALLAFALVFSFINIGSRVEEVSISTAIEDIQNNKVSQIYAYDGQARVMLVEAESKVKGNERKDIETYADYYFNYTASSLEIVIEAIESHNQEVRISGSGEIVEWSNPPTKGSFLDVLFPILYIGLGILVIVFIFKTINRSNGNAMQFGKSKARMSSNVKVRFGDIAGADEEKEELAEIVEFLKNPKRFTDLGARIPKGVLLVGNPGTGKTLLARAVAGESNVPFLQISGSDFVEMFVGVGASRVRDLFDQAKKCQPCIVFIDEIDAVGRQRGAGLGGGNDEREQTLNQLLVEMDGFEANEGIIVLAATNRADVLDPALLRPGRFDRQVYVHIPDVKGREGIIKIHAKNKPIDENIDFQTLARMTGGFTGADLENMLNEAAILAARNHRAKIIMEDISEGINKVIMGPQKKSMLVTDNDKIITAYHESGHAIIGKTLENCEEVQEVSIIPRGNAAGYTMSRPDNDDNHMGKNKLNDEIAMMMGGRISEELFMKDISTGASNDIKRATELARKMVTEWGMSDKFGFMSFDSSEEIFVGRDYQNKNNYSETTAAQIDAEVKAILDYNYKRAKEVISKNANTVKEMAELLLKQNTIYKEEVDMLMAGKSSEEISLIMEEQIKARKKEEEKVKLVREQDEKIEAIDARLKTAEMYLKQGIISKNDYELVLKENNTSIENIKAEYAEKLKALEEPKVEEKKAEPEKVEMVAEEVKVKELKTDEPKETEEVKEEKPKKTRKSSKDKKENKDEEE